MPSSVTANAGVPSLANATDTGRKPTETMVFGLLAVGSQVHDREVLIALVRVRVLDAAGVGPGDRPAAVGGDGQRVGAVRDAADRAALQRRRRRTRSTVASSDSTLRTMTASSGPGIALRVVGALPASTVWTSSVAASTYATRPLCGFAVQMKRPVATGTS